MAKGRMVWDKVGDRLYETGVDMAAVFPMSGNGYGEGEAWNGLTAVNEQPGGAEATALYANNAKYGELISNETFGGTIEAYTYPDGFAKCNGVADIIDSTNEIKTIPGVSVTMQTRVPFGLVYQNKIGNDTEGIAHDVKIHFVYNARVTPSEKNNATINENVEAGTMSWTFTTTPVAVPGMDKTSHIYITKSKVGETKWKVIEDMVYGTSDTEPKFPTPEELITMMKANG